jgi:tyrosyl-tRNA synthetase
MLFVEVLQLAGLASSKSDARRGIKGKGFYLNGEPITDVDRMVTPGDLRETGGRQGATLRKGKTNLVKLIVE